ncbi:MAG TPA: baseplate J/gp47 family protein [Enhygromyxa sp.]|nr:baseplate J/gp47 family protein [Enhygromyxa sp.]
MPAPSFEDLFAAAKNEALARPTRLTPEIFDVEGGNVNIAIAAGVAMAERVGSYAQRQLNALRLSTVASVSDEAVEELAASEFNEFKRGDVAAIVPLVFQRDPSLTASAVPVGTICATAGGVTFKTTADLLFQGGQTGPITVAALATTAGPGGNVARNTITRIVSQLEDTTISVNNPEPAAGGRPAETNEDVLSRCSTAYQRARKGTLEAIEAEAAIVEGVVSARVYEQLDGTGLTGRVVVQILGNGRTTNSALAERVRARLRTVRAAGVPVIVVALAPRVVTIRALGVRVQDGFDVAAVLSAARRALLAYVEGLQVGATLYRANLIATLTTIEGLLVPEGSLASPVTDAVPGDGEYLTAMLSRIIVNTAG